MRLPVRAKLRDLDVVMRARREQPGPKNERYFDRTSDGKIILRQILRAAAGDVVEGAKQGFSAPDASWFRGESIDYVQRLILGADARIYQFLRPDTIRARRRAPERRRKTGAAHLFAPHA